MKCAVPVTGGMMSPHFGHCEQFALFDVEEQSKEITKKEFVTSPEHQPFPGGIWRQACSPDNVYFSKQGLCARHSENSRTAFARRGTAQHTVAALCCSTFDTRRY